MFSEFISHIDGLLFTNHVIAGYVNGMGPLTINGSVISRNEGIFAAPGIIMNHDARLSGRSWEDLGFLGGGGLTWKDIKVEAWWTGTSDGGGYNVDT